MSSKRFPIVGGAILLTATVAVYVGSLWNDFVEFDDNLYVTRNNNTAAGISLSGLHYAWTTIATGNWIPLTWLSLQLDASLFGISAAGFHATNVILHVANVLLLFAWLLRVTGSRWSSFIVAGFFGLHPLHVESVAWVSERKDVLSTFFMLIALLAYERHALRPSLKWYLATCAAFSLGLLSKSMLVTLPILLLVIDFWPLERWRASAPVKGGVYRYSQLRPGYLFLEKLPLFGISLLDGILTITAQSQSTAFNHSGSSLIDRLSGTVHNYGWYIAKTFMPTQLIALYPRPTNGPAGIEVVAAALLLIGISIYVVFQGTRRKYLVFGWLWYLISLLPVIGLLQVGFQSHADRYTYVPHIGLFVLIVWECSYWVSRFPATRSIFAVATAIAALCMAWLTVCQVAVWRTTDRLWEHAISIDLDNPYAHGSLAHHCLETGRIDEAVKHFDYVLRQHPEKKMAIDAFVDIYRRYSERPETESQFRTELGLYYVQENSTELARIAFERAVAISPENLLARYKLALALGDLGQFDEAVLHLEKVIKQEPREIGAHVAMGLLLEKMGRFSDARDQFAIVLKHNPGNETTINKIRSLNRRLGLQ